MIPNLVIFGATGDLAERFLLPALATLRATGRLPAEFAIVGTARAQWDDETFRHHISEQLAAHAAGVPPEHRDALTRSLRYRYADLTDADDVAALIRLAGDGPVAAYLALPPGLFGTTVTALGDARLPAGSRVALEKPFGESLEDAVALNHLLTRTAGEAGEQAIFRVDHALGMVTVQNLLALRRHDPLLAAAWDAEHIKQVEVRWEEDLALEGRASYYDRAGAVVVAGAALEGEVLLPAHPTCSMCSASQTAARTGSWRRRARRFCTVVMPRAWSTRKTASSPASPTTPATISSSATASLRLSPNGFSSAIRLPAGRWTSPSAVTVDSYSAGGSAR